MHEHEVALLSKPMMPRLGQYTRPRFGADIQSLVGNSVNPASTLSLVHSSHVLPMPVRFIGPAHPVHTDNFASSEQGSGLPEAAGT